MTTNKQLAATTARIHAARVEADKAKSRVCHLINEAYPEGATIRVRHGNGSAVVRVIHPWGLGGRENCVRVVYPNSRKRFLRDVHYSDVLEVLDDNQ